MSKADLGALGALWQPISIRNLCLRLGIQNHVLLREGIRHDFALLRLRYWSGFEERDLAQNSGGQWAEVLHVLGDEKHSVAIPEKPVIGERLAG